MNAGQDEDLRAFQDEQRRSRRRRGAVFAVVGIVLIVVSISARGWAARMEEIQAASSVQMLLPRYTMIAAWGTIVLGVVLLVAGSVALATTLRGGRASGSASG